MTTTGTGYHQIAYISRSKGLKGEVVLQPASDLPLSSYVGVPLWVVPPLLEGVRKTHFLGLKEQAKDCVAQLAGVDDFAMARLLAGHYLLAQTALVVDLPAVGPANPAEDLVGRVVIDVDTRVVIGAIREVRHTFAQELWVVDGGPYGEVLIPAVDAFIRSLDKTAAWVSLPKGLLELNH